MRLDARVDRCSSVLTRRHALGSACTLSEAAKTRPCRKIALSMSVPRRRILGFIVLAAWGLALPLRSQPAPFDLLIHNGQVFDGTDNPWLAADVGIRGNRVVAMGRLHEASAA